MLNIAIADTSLADDEIEAAVAVMRSGALRQGKESDSFEREFAARTGAVHAVTCANGTAALHLVYARCLKPGDEVLVPAFTFIATASMVSMVGAKPIFCDVDPKTFLIDLDDATRKLTPRTRAIAPVHLFGNPCDPRKIRDFADGHELIVIWDAAQAHGATFGGADVGSFGAFTCYSFYPSKNMFCGEGGLVCMADAADENAIRYLRSHGQTGKYYHTALGFNYRMTDIAAAILRKQLDRLDDMLARRRRNARMLNTAINQIEGLTPQEVSEGGEHAWHQYCVLVEPEKFGTDRDGLAEKLKAQGVATGVHYPRGLHQQPIFREMYGKSELAVTEYLSSHILALPVHHGLSEQDVEDLIGAVGECARV